MPESNEAIQRIPDLLVSVIGARPGNVVELARGDDIMSKSSWRAVGDVR